MFAIIGLIIVVASVVGGYALGGGHFTVLWQPGEFIIIGGAAFGAFLVSNSKHVILTTLKSIPLIFRGAKYHRHDFQELLCLMYLFFRIARTKGDMALEQHVENPENSSVFSQFPKILKDEAALDFICGYMRLLTLGTNNANDIEGVMDAEIEAVQHEKDALSGSLQTVADGTPALGIVAAVLGVIHTMGAISEPPEILGVLIGAALVGTFFGVLLSYGFVGPISSGLKSALTSDIEYLKVLKASLVGHMQGHAPQISVEFGRKSLPMEARPSFAELDQACQTLSIPS